MTDELPWLTLSEAADLTGLNRETVRSRARRGLIPYRRSNRGEMVVQIAGAATGADREATGAVTDPDRGLAEVVTELQEEITDLRDRVTKAEADRDRAVEVAAARVEASERIIAELRAEVEYWRRPWWRRW